MPDAASHYMQFHRRMNGSPIPMMNASHINDDMRMYPFASPFNPISPGNDYLNDLHYNRINMTSNPLEKVDTHPMVSNFNQINATVHARASPAHIR